MKSRRMPLVVVLFLAVLGAAGCGGGGGDSTESTATTNAATPTALTKAELIEQGDAICAEVNAAVGSVGASSAENDPTARAAGLYSGMVSSLNNLGTPQESAGYAEFSSAAEELAKAEDEVKLAAERGDATALETAESSATSALSAFQEAAEEYGFEDCAEGPSAPVPSTGTAESEGTEGAEAAEESEAVEPEAVEPEAEAEPAPEPAPETGGGAGAVEGGGTGGGTEGGGGTTGGGSGGIGPG